MWHPLLVRQLRKAGIDPCSPPDEACWQRLLERVSLSYEQSDSDRYTLERSLDVASEEMCELYESLRVRSETELARERDRLHSVVDAIGDGLCAVDAEGALLFANPAARQLLGWRAGDRCGEPLFELLSLRLEGRDAPVSMADVADLTPLRGEDAWLFDGPEGTPRPVAFVLNPIGSTTLEGAVLVFRDMTESRRLQLRLRQAVQAAEHASQSKSRFLATMSHEIRTPMNGVIGMLSLLLGTPLSAQQQEFAETAHTSGKALLSLINDILDFSKIEAGKLELEAIPCDVGTIVEDVADLLAERAQAKGLEMVVRVGRDLPASLLGDPVRLRQVLVNLTGNAIKFTETGHIDLRVRVLRNLGDRVELGFEVEDTGVGIPEDVRDNLFEAFTQADSSTTRRFGGTGLGLAICRHLVAAMDGTLRVESAVGLGSCFAFSAWLEVGTGATPGPAAAALDRMRVLVFEPHDATREVLVDRLVELGICTQTARDPHQAWTLLQRAFAAGAAPDAILLERRQAEETGDGPSLLERLESDPALSNVPVLLTSTWCDLRGDREPDVLAVLTRPVRRHPLRTALLAALRSEPGAATSESPPRERQPQPADASRTAPAHILLVEDNATNQRVAQHMLQRLGHEVSVAENGREALDALDRLDIELVLMDCQMPVMDGFEATSRIRERGAPWNDLPIVAMTANALKGDRERCLDAGMDDYVAKPISLTSLSEALGRWLPDRAPTEG